MDEDAKVETKFRLWTSQRNSGRFTQNQNEEIFQQLIQNFRKKPKNRNKLLINQSVRAAKQLLTKQMRL